MPCLPAIPCRFSAPTLAALALVPCLSAQRAIDGSGNNPLNPTIGQAGIPLLRKAPAEYGDGLSAPAGATRQSARAISNLVVAQGPVSLPNAKNASDWLWQWGQLLDHDLDLSGSANPVESFDILVPTGDPSFDPFNTGTQVIPLNRSAYSTDASSVRQQMNDITAWIDGSMVYGSDDARAAELRAFDGKGKLKVTLHPDGDLLPFNVNGFPNAPTANDPTLFLAGDVRVNEQVGLTAAHTLFVREHNFLCEMFSSRSPGLTDEQYYQMARAIVGAEIQKITYSEFLPLLLGPNALPKYGGYDPTINAGIANEFSTACYRVGHTLLSSVLLRLGPDLQPIPAGNLPLMNAFFNPSEILDNGGVDPILLGLARQAAQEIDNKIVDDVRNFLFGPPGSGGLDLASLNIQRGRDHGLADYNEVRAAFGLPRVTSFAELTSDPNLAAALFSAFGTVDEIDLWVGALAEDHLPKALVGETLFAVLSDQFLRLRDGDRFWYQIALPRPIVAIVEQQTLSKVIRRNSSIGKELQPNAFVVPRKVAFVN